MKRALFITVALLIAVPVFWKVVWDRIGLRSLNQVPIEYYGIVVDEAGVPLHGTTVNWSVANGLGPSHRPGSTVSDSQGRFSIKGVRGKGLSAIPERTGYRFVATNGGAIYSYLWPKAERHVPDPQKPVVLTMHKWKGGEPLVRIEYKTFRIWPTNTEIRLDLVRGMMVSELGDLILRIPRPPEMASTNQGVRWAVELASEGGGIQLMDDMLMRAAYEAPADGYQQSIHLEKLPNDPQGTESMTRGAALRSREGMVYTKLGFTVGFRKEPDQPGWIRVSSLSNTNGSRNWEEEPSKITRIGR